MRDRECLASGTPQAPPRREPYTTARAASKHATGDYPSKSSSNVEGPRPKFRGLRAFAVLLVVLYRVWVGLSLGGVDDLPLHLRLPALALLHAQDQLEQTPQSLQLLAHVFQRLLYVATVIYLGYHHCVLLRARARSRSIRKPNRRKGLLFYFRTGTPRSAHTVDYYAKNALVRYAALWSRSIQGRIFIIWPLLFAAVTYVVHADSAGPYTCGIRVFCTVFVASLTFSLHRQETDTPTKDYLAGTTLTCGNLPSAAPAGNNIYISFSATPQVEGTRKGSSGYGLGRYHRSGHLWRNPAR